MDNNIRKKILSIFAASLLMLCVSCNLTGTNHRIPTSTGQPYEVVLEGDTDSILTQILTEDVPFLPQSEPLCDLIQVKHGKCQGSYLMVRNRIVVDIDKNNKGFEAKTQKDLNASPQTVISIKAKSADELRQKLKNTKLLQQAIDLQELQNLVDHIKPNTEKQHLVKKMFGLDMKIPASMDFYRKSKGFLWLSNNASTGMQNLLVFRLKGNGTDTSTIKDNGTSFTYAPNEVNKVLKRYMLGETDQMYMQLIESEHLGNWELRNEDFWQEPLDESNPYRVQCLWKRGLWEMKGDAMGGPYVLKVVPMSQGKPLSPYEQTSRKIDSRIVLIAFVYAPEKKKRNLTKQLEAMLATIRLTKTEKAKH